MTTAEELVNAVGSIGLTKGKFTCDYCKKSFQREGTLLAHSCEKKRRWQSKLNQDVLVGFASYDLFYRIEMQSKPKEYKDFPIYQKLAIAYWTNHRAKGYFANSKEGQDFMKSREQKLNSVLTGGTE